MLRAVYRQRATGLVVLLVLTVQLVLHWRCDTSKIEST